MNAPIHHIHIFMEADPLGWGAPHLTRIACYDYECSGLDKKYYPEEKIGPRLKTVTTDAPEAS